MTYKIIANVFSDAGKYRSMNQDNYYLNGKIRDQDKAVSRCGLTTPDGVFAVCDGMGGESAGELASGIIAEEFQKAGDPADIDDAAVRRIIDKANSRICTHILESKENSGSTFVCAVIRGKKATISNIGDSRCYLIRNGKIRQLTKDHTLAAQMVENGMMTPEEARNDKRRHQLTQHLGIFPEEMTLSVFRRSIDVQLGDTLILCTDGITDGLEDQDILDIVSNNKKPEHLSKELTEAAYKKGSRDNATAIALSITDDPDERMIRILFLLICICSGILGGLLAVITLMFF